VAAGASGSPAQGRQGALAASPASFANETASPVDNLWITFAGGLRDVAKIRLALLDDSENCLLVSRRPNEPAGQSKRLKALHGSKTAGVAT
jgi:hypothetical protein